MTASLLLRRFARARGGAAAIEAALLLPVILMLLSAGIELTYGLNARRAVQNASYSLVQTAAGVETIDSATRAILANGQALAVSGYPLRNVRVELRNYLKDASGSFSRDWSWSPTETRIEMSENQIVSDLQSNVVNKESTLVAIVEADYVPFFGSLLPFNLDFRGFNSQVPIKKSVAILR